MSERVSERKNQKREEERAHEKEREHAHARDMIYSCGVALVSRID